MTHNLLDSFQQKRNALIDAYQTLPQLGELLELGGVSNQQLANWQHKLQKEHFTLCVAGQMNAGKSTLINALVFGRNVLPVYDTVMTSTITQIEHQSKHPQQEEGATVQFYSHNEWQQLKQQMQSNETLQQSFEEALNQAQLKGARVAELIGSPIRTLTGFENLSQYIAPLTHNKEGIYTPFVKQVTIYANNPLLKDLIVVDTPGINDPNEIRANLTETWIKNADAVLYVTYAGQALSKPDIDFIHRFMIHVANTHRIIAINKIDCIDNPYQLDQWLLSLQNNQDSEAIKQIFSAKTPIVKVCALASLLENSQQPLDDESQWYKDDFSEKGYLGTGKHNMDELKKAISQRILANKANGIISSHQQHIEGLFYKLLNTLNNQKATHEQTLLDTAYTKKQLEQERAGLQDKQVMLSKKLFELTEFTAEKVADSTSVLKKAENELSNIFTQHLNTKLHDKNTYSKLQAEAAWYIKQEFEDLICDKLVSTIKQQTNELKKQIDSRNQLLYEELKGLDILMDSKIELILGRAIYANIQHFDIDTNTLSAKVASTISNNTWFLQRWLNHKIEDVKALIISSARDELIKLIKYTSRDVIEKIHTSTEAFTHEVEKNINIEVEKRREMLLQLVNQDVLLGGKQLEARQAIQLIEKQILTAKNIEQTINGYLT
ncbi:MAG: dynamin family protein [Pseudomonadales bacterium]|nr:dynamin family protein [Pseudomonadales bacterium]